MERIQKILAHGGIASRRAAEQLIKAGRVRVNGRVITELGTKADPRRDRIEVDGKRVVQEGHIYIVLHKPRGVVSTMHDPEGRPTVAELLASLGARVYPVGRLDFSTSGVLLATNDGELADGLLHPRKTVPKTYVLKVKGVMTPDDLEVWRKGIRLEDGMTLPADAKLLRHEGDKTWLELTIREGRNQQIRRMGEASGFPVMRLARVAFAEISAEGLAPGRWRHLTRDELLELKKTYGVPRSVAAAATNESQPPRRLQSKAIQPTARRGTAGRTQRAFGSEERRSSDQSGGQERGGSSDREDSPRDGGGGGRGRTGGRDQGRGRGGPPPARNNERGETRGRGGPPARNNERGETRGRGAPVRGGADRGRSAGRSGAAAGDRPESRGRDESRGRAAGGGGGGRGSSTQREEAPTPRFGGGSPGRRSGDVSEDWGGGSGRGHSRPSDRDVNASAENSSSSSGDRPRGDVGGGRLGRTRTTGTSGGIGSRDNAPRVKSRRR